MPGKTKCSARRKLEYTAYKLENRAEKNKERKLVRHLSTHPNDIQSENRTKAKIPIVKEHYSLFEASKHYLQTVVHRGVR